MEVKYQAGAFKLTIRGVGGLFALLYIPFLKLFHNPSSITKVLSFVSFSLSKVLKFSLLTYLDSTVCSLDFPIIFLHSLNL